MNIDDKLLDELTQAQNKCREEFLERENVMGVGIGIKHKDGKPTDEPALITLVTHKVSPQALSDENIVPETFEGIPTDVISVGHPQIEPLDMEPLDIDIQNMTSNQLNSRIRPVKGGYSVGHPRITAGTLGVAVTDLMPGSSVGPNPSIGHGMPNKYFILSNNHVLANNNDARPGDPILSPGPIDGGRDPQDRIGRLTRFVPIQMSPMTPLSQHNNLVDGAIAECNLDTIDRAIHWSGHIRGWRRKRDVALNTRVKKTGRTTGFTTGEIISIGATVDINFGGNRVARFHDQIICTNMSEGGDSGSLITTMDNVAVGLLFAGSPTITIANQIENVRNLLKIEIGDQIL